MFLILFCDEQKAFEEGGELCGKKVYVFGCTEGNSFVQRVSFTFTLFNFMLLKTICWCKNPLAPEKLESGKPRSPPEPAREV